MSHCKVVKDTACQNNPAHYLRGIKELATSCVQACPTALEQPRCAYYYGAHVGMDGILVHLLRVFNIGLPGFYVISPVT